MATTGELRARIVARVWQAIAQQDISDAAFAADKQAQLVESIADGVIAEIGSLQERELVPPAGGVNVSGTVATAVPTAEEHILWEGRPLLSLTTRYVITTERIRIITGLLSRSREDIELIRVQDIDQRQRFFQRLLGIGTIFISSADATKPAAWLRHIRDPLKVHEVIRRAMLDQRRISNFAFRQEFSDNR